MSYFNPKNPEASNYVYIPLMNGSKPYVNAKIIRFASGNEVLVSCGVWILKRQDGRLFRLACDVSRASAGHLRAYADLSINDYKALPPLFEQRSFQF